MKKGALGNIIQINNWFENCLQGDLDILSEKIV